LKLNSTTSLYTPWTEAEVLSHLTTGWDEGAIIELKLEYLDGPEPKVFGGVIPFILGSG
jgi:hypothetical protein